MKIDFQKKMPGPVRLSVLMPVYNERYLIDAAVRRVLAFEHHHVRELELIIVEDCSTDGTRDVLQELAREFPQIRLFLQPRNRGKGAAIRRAIREASGELSVIQDADLEYDPSDWALLLRPFFEQNADAVYGSRFLAPEYHRVLYFWHSLGNRFLTLLSNIMTDLNLTDMETCYKMVRTELLKSIPIRSNDFSMEPEITAKLAKRGAVIYEVPVSYAGRTYREGKKITMRHGITGLLAILRWQFIDDIYQDDEYGSAILTSLNQVHKFNNWMAEFITNDIGERVLEIGAGIGNLTQHLLPRLKYSATDINHHYLTYLHNMSMGKPYLDVQELDLEDERNFEQLAGQYDTVVCLNVLEHVGDAPRSLRNLHRALVPGGRAIILVPQGKWLYASLDEVLGHFKRYGRDELIQEMEDAGFRVVSARDFNKMGVMGWVLNGKLLRRKNFSSVQLKIFNILTPIFRLLEPVVPWPGLSIVVVGEKPPA